MVQKAKPNQEVIFRGKPLAQGDVFIRGHKGKIPEAYTKKDSAEPVHLVAHSETGHHHVIDSHKVDMYESVNDPFIMYLVVHEETKLLHERAFHTHKEITLPPGNYKVSRQRESIPEGYRRAAD